MSELLAPAGNIEALDAAFGEGADAVYMGLKSFNARLRSSNFAWNQFEAAVQAAHKRDKKIYVTVNTVSEEMETERLYRFLGYLNDVHPDGLIVQDFGVVRMCQEFFPDLELHASTQMNVASVAGVNLLSKQGFTRCVVARELGLKEIQDIKAKTNTELEVFTHGALCVSESGLCLFSSYLGGKSANRGMCTQACRRFYSADCDGRQEEGYYFSPYDLQLLEKIPDLMTAGVESFKIEGRMKSAEYVGSVVSAYRYVMDHWQEDRKGAIATGKRILATDFARAKTLYWYEPKKAEHAENLLDPKQAGGTGIYLGKIDRTRKDDHGTIFATIIGGTYDPEIGDSIRLHKKDDTGRVSHKIKQIKGDMGADATDRWIDIPEGFNGGDPVYLLQTKAMSKRYQRVLPSDLSPYRKQPGPQRLPLMELAPVPKKGFEHFPEGVYVQVSTIKDVFQIVGDPMVIRVIIELNSSTAAELLDPATKLPFGKRQVIISLDPFLPQEKEPVLDEQLAKLVELGFSTFIVNNLSHIQLLKNKQTPKGQKVAMIGGPYLYTFNRWAVSFLENQNIETFITPIENNRDNLEATFDGVQRKKAMITLFAYPALFRMRFQLPKSYEFLYFRDKEGVEFKALSTEDGSFVLPEKPFSIIDNYQRMQRQGFTHFLLDFSKTAVDRGDFRYIMRALNKGEVLSDTDRFNWKDGFYNPEKLENYKASAERAAEERRAAKGGRPNRNGNRPGRGTGTGRPAGRTDTHARNHKKR